MPLPTYYPTNPADPTRISIANGATVAIGTDSLWGPLASAVNVLIVAGRIWFVDAVTDDTHLVIPAWDAADVVDAEYRLIQFPASSLQAAKDIQDHLARLARGGVPHVVPAGEMPDDSFGNDTDTAFRFDATSISIWVKEAGTFVLRTVISDESVVALLTPDDNSAPVTAANLAALQAASDAAEVVGAPTRIAAGVYYADPGWEITQSAADPVNSGRTLPVGDGMGATVLIPSGAGTFLTVYGASPANGGQQRGKLRDISFQRPGAPRTGIGIKMIGVSSNILESVDIEGFNIGLDMVDCLVDWLANCIIVHNGIGIRAQRNTGSRPNLFTLEKTYLADNTYFAVTVTEGASWHVLNCGIESNGTHGDPDTGAFNINGCPQEGGVGFLVEGGYCQGNKGGQTFLINAQGGPGTYAFLGVEFGRVTAAAYETNFIQLRKTAGGHVRITIDSCSNGAFNDYVRSASRRFFAVAAGAVDNDYHVEFRNMDMTLVDAPVIDGTLVAYSDGSNLGTNGQVMIGQTAKSPLFKPVSGAITINENGVTAFGAIAAGTILGNNTGGAAPAAATSVNAIIDQTLGATPDTILIRGASAWGGGKITTSLFATGVADTDTALTANSDTRFATQKAAKAYIDAQIPAQIAALDVEVFKGSIDCSANPNYPAASAGHVYRVSVAGKIGGASGPEVEVADRLECFVDGTAAGTHAAVGASWMITQANVEGVVTGPAATNADYLAIWDSTTRKLKQNTLNGKIDIDLGATLDMVLYRNGTQWGGRVLEALTRVNDTNVTLTLGGTPATALLKATSVTVGWSGTLAASRGGWGADISAQTGIALITAGVASFLGSSGSGNVARVTTPSLSSVNLSGSTNMSGQLNISYAGAALSMNDTGGASGVSFNLARSGTNKYAFTANATDDFQIYSIVVGNDLLKLTAAGGAQFPNAGTTVSAPNVFLDGSNTLLKVTSTEAAKRDIEPVDEAIAIASLELWPIWFRADGTADDPKHSFYSQSAEKVAAFAPQLAFWGYPDDAYETVVGLVSVPAIPDWYGPDIHEPDEFGPDVYGPPVIDQSGRVVQDGPLLRKGPLIKRGAFVSKGELIRKGQPDMSYHRKTRVLKRDVKMIPDGVSPALAFVQIAGLIAEVRKLKAEVERLKTAKQRGL